MCAKNCKKRNLCKRTEKCEIHAKKKRKRLNSCKRTEKGEMCAKDLKMEKFVQKN